MYSQGGLGLIVHGQISGDPTHTLTLRRAYAAQMTKRFRALKGVIRKSLIDNDALGLKNKQQNQSITKSITNAPPGGKSAEAIKGQFSSIPARRFDFARSSDKIEGFMEWLEQQEEQGILEITQQQQIGRAIENQWQNTYIRSAYQKGILRARQEMQNAGYAVPDVDEVGGINAVFNQPAHSDRCGAVFTRVYNELKGITDAMDQQISRTLAEGLARGDGPEKVALAINDRVDKVGLSRARTMARTEIIRAHHVSTIAEYRNAGVEGVKIKAEWSIAGDNRVCEICRPLEGQVFDLDTIEGMIPRHPNCLISSTVPIYTSEGWKSIGNIEVGDFVFTHKQRFRKVYALPREQVVDPVTVTVYVPAIDDSIEITEGHPVLVVAFGSSFVWKEAGELNNSDWCIVDLIDEDVKACLVKVTKQAKTGSFDLYNLSVEEDESYIVKGVVVHNCRCCALPIDKTEAEKEVEAERRVEAESEVASSLRQNPEGVEFERSDANAKFNLSLRTTDPEDVRIDDFDPSAELDIVSAATQHLNETITANPNFVRYLDDDGDEIVEQVGKRVEPSIQFTNRTDMVGMGVSTRGGVGSRTRWCPYTLKQEREVGRFDWGVDSIYVHTHEMHHVYGSGTEFDSFSDVMALDYHLSVGNTLAPDTVVEELRCKLMAAMSRATGKPARWRTKSRAILRWLNDRNPEAFREAISEVVPEGQVEDILDHIRRWKKIKE